MADPTITLDSPGLAKLVAQIAAALRSDVGLRQLQGENAPQLKVLNSGITVTPNAIVTIPEAQVTNVEYPFMLVMIQSGSGTGRFTTNTQQPTAAGFGFPIPANGFSFAVRGVNNIKQFQIIAETAQTLNLTYGLFQ